VRPDLTGARLLAIGDGLRMTQADVDAFLPALRPLFGDAGLPLDAPVPARWYLRLPREAPLPPFAGPDEALGADLFEHLPEGAEGRRWRALLSETQVVLHNHPRNAERVAQGLPPINSLWFWGGGVLPDHVRTPHGQIRTHDPMLQALADVSHGDDARNVLVDYRALATLDDGFFGWIEAAVRGDLGRLTLDFADGVRCVVERRQRWRVWRTPTREIST
jgi:hypothetical protein